MNWGIVSLLFWLVGILGVITIILWNDNKDLRMRIASLKRVVDAVIENAENGEKEEYAE